jgi:biotin-(acetyl-CoA carboxylase) ligase
MAPHRPTFPPLIKGHAVEAGKSPFNRAIKRARSGKLGAGDLLWSRDAARLDLALVLEPEVTAQRCGEMLFVAAVAFGDAAGAVIPPEVAITYRWPGAIEINGATAGSVRLMRSQGDAGDVPDWLVLGLRVNIMPQSLDGEPGERLDTTTLWDEGCGEVTGTHLLESVVRHMVNWIHTWSEDGFRPVHELWWQRRSSKTAFEAGLVAEVGTLLGLDENGNAMLKTSAETTVLFVDDALMRLGRASANRA